MQEIISSRDNPQIKRYTGLTARKKERDAEACFASEGLRLCLDAVGSGVALRILLLTEEAAGRYPETKKLVEAADRVFWLDGGLAGRISDTKTPQGVFAVMEKLDNRKSAVTIKSGGCYLLLHSVQDPGNVGAILRTADALGMDGVCLSPGCADPYSPKVLRGSMGGVFRIPFVDGADIASMADRMRKEGVPVYAAALEAGALEAGSADFSAGGAVLIGNEGNGLPRELTGACTDRIMIPMREGANSLNAAVAAGILMWEMTKRR